MKIKKVYPYSKVLLVGKRVELRPYKFSDFKNCKASHANRLKSVNKFDQPLPIGKEVDYEKFKKRVARYRERAKKRHIFVFGLFDKVTGEHIGQFDLLTFNQELLWGNLGYHVHNQYFRKGYAKEGAMLTLKAGFELLGFHRIEASMDLDNKASRKVCESIGLEYEGIRKEFFPDERGVSIRVYATNVYGF